MRKRHKVTKSYGINFVTQRNIELSSHAYLYFRDPNSEELPFWPVYTMQDKQHIILDTKEKLQIGQNWREQKCFFWNNIVKSLREAVGKIVQSEPSK